MPLNRMTRLTLLAVVAGAVVAAGAMPAAALANWAVEKSAPAYDTLPEVLKHPTTAQASYLYANDGQTVVTTFYDENRRDVTLAEVAPVVPQAVVAAEDARFYSHHGVDLKGVLRAVVANGASGGVSQGASTLTMQYVRNVLKSDPSLSTEQRAEATEQTPARKIREARYALAVEKELSKAQILERYLNIAYFGSGAYGIYAASHTYFSKDPAQLSLSEASLLAGLLQSPEADSPLNGGIERALARRDYVLTAMTGTGAITAAQAEAAKASTPVVKKGSSPNDCTASRAGWGFFCDYFRSWWRDQDTFGDTAEDREQALRQGGYRIVTTLDPKVQNAAQAQVTKVYGYTDKRALPMAVVEPGTGKVLALAVNRYYSAAPGAGNTMNQLVAGGTGIHGYQAGSTFKMFTMLAALEAGKTLDTGFDAPTKLTTAWPEATGPASCDGFWCPRNANPEFMDGERDMWTGFGRSVNTYFVWLEQQVGADKTIEMAQRLGIRFRHPDNASHAASDAAGWGSFVLGVSLTTPLDLANAYATLAADGVYCAPLPVAAVTDGAGRQLDVANTSCAPAISPEIARAATDAARCPVGQSGAFGRCDGGTATAVSGLLDGRAVAGKTGSSTDNMTESFVAYTPQLAAAAIAANPDKPTDAVGAAVLSKVYRAVAATLATGSQGLEVKDFPAPLRESAFSAQPDPEPTESDKPRDESHTGDNSQDNGEDRPGRGDSGNDNNGDSGNDNGSGGDNGSDGGGGSGDGRPGRGGGQGGGHQLPGSGR
ncbi:transglycosylase domain-containing protein [Catellatospora citrea]|uniref:Carboxypeptidase n=1 Tax=Catellatospora citrea TaxID=53366 RepID=A0A8J3KIZ2_9ACTN|nr:transglycosylase domain-containing protein [Catellatospora citrea]RKE11679.1 membrane peptidoglycan carboxypeptidase [Catellatospora citrea]GIF99728.1 carboxypeptidase [Catellatospora citrea]